MNWCCGVIIFSMFSVIFSNTTLPATTTLPVTTTAPGTTTPGTTTPGTTTPPVTTTSSPTTPTSDINCTFTSTKDILYTCPQSIAIKWTWEPSDPSCFASNLTLTCNNLPHYFPIENKTETYLVTLLTGLEFDHEYKCIEYIDNDMSHLYTFNFSTTKVDPIQISPNDVTDTSFSLTWNIPNYNYNSTDLTYDIVINYNAAHYVPAYCDSLPDIEPINDISNTYYNFTEASPDYNYDITITARNAQELVVTNGNITVKTKSSGSGEPRNLTFTTPKLDVTTNTISNEITWNNPCFPNGNLTKFIISVNAVYSETGESYNKIYNITINDTSDNYSYPLTHLWPYSEYNISVHAVNNENVPGSFAYTDFETPDKIPDTPESITVQDVGTTYFKISWDKPAGKFGNITHYTINISSIGALYDYDKVMCGDMHEHYFYSTELPYDKTYLNFQAARAYYNHTVIITASTSEEEGTPGTTSAVTLPGIPEAPYNLTLTFKDNLTYILNWISPCYANGNIVKFQVNRTGSYTEDASLTDEPLTLTVNKSDGYYYNQEVTLKESYNYTLDVSAVIIDEIIGERAVIKNVTDPGIPDVPSSLQIDSSPITENFIISWSPPEKKNGRIEGYDIKITALNPLYRYLENCTMTNFTSVETSTLSTSVSVNLNMEQFFYYFNYSVAIRANTSKGYGEYSNMFIESVTGEPEDFDLPKADIKIDTQESYDATAKISFQPPCFLNGDFVNYTLNYVAREGLDVYKPQQQLVSYNLSTFDFIISLQPDLQYFYNLTIYTEFHNKTVEGENFPSPAGVPVVSFAPQAIPMEMKDTEAEVTLNKSYFENPNGKVRYISLILSNKNVTGGEYGGYDPDYWPTVKHDEADIYYQITEDKWEPFKGRDVTTFTIGNDTESCSTNSSYCNKPLEPNTEYYLIVRSYTKNFYRNSDPIRFKTKDMKKITIIVSVTVSLAFIAGLGFLYFLWRRNKLHIPQMFYRKSSFAKETPRTSSTCVSVKRFIQYVKTLENNPEKLKEQYVLLGENSKELSLNYSTDFAKLVENRRKNRYINILPFDDTRVKLLIDEDDDLGSDYINASYIKGYNGRIEYIATQGPLAATCRDFWKMILQENVTIIVMVSQFVEQDKEKCYRYFPKNKETMTVDDIEVKCCTELHFGIYCVRTLQVARECLQITVVHMQFLDWPDFGVPRGTEHMLQFCYQLRKRIKLEGDGCAVVHCSAGVGRTGTLIATDILLQAANAERDLDVFNTVLELRKQRINMVQTEKQYIYIHHLIRDHLSRPPTPDINEDVSPIYENMSVLQERFEDEDEKTEKETKF